jgi:hypothetical protein
MPTSICARANDDVPMLLYKLVFLSMSASPSAVYPKTLIAAEKSKCQS